jgi:hypothetical protein
MKDLIKQSMKEAIKQWNSGHINLFFHRLIFDGCFICLCMFFEWRFLNFSHLARPIKKGYFGLKTIQKICEIPRNFNVEDMY